VTARGLGPYCALCAEQDRCEAAGTVLPDYPECRVFLRDTPPDRIRALFDHLLAVQGRGDDRLEALVGRLLARFAVDTSRFSEILEPSVSYAGGAWHAMRFSYAFPAFREEPRGTVREILGLCEPFGAKLRSFVRALLGPIEDPCVNKPLFGIAYDGAERWRIKLYVEFTGDAGARAIGLAARMLSGAVLAARGDLHLLGIDLGPKGITAAKLYFRRPEVRTASFHETVGPVDLVRDLARRGVDRLNNVLVIHRLARADDPGANIPAEVDFALAENGLRWQDVRDAPALGQALRAPGSPLEALQKAFRLGFRRISIPVGRADKLNAYYVLAEAKTRLSPVPVPSETV